MGPDERGSLHARLAEAEAELASLRDRLAEAEETLEAIRSGAVDALIVRGDAGNEVYTLTTADRVFRELVEQMSDGAATIGDDDTILWTNHQLAQLVGWPVERLLGGTPSIFATRDALAVLEAGRKGKKIADVELRRADGTLVPVRLSATPVAVGGVHARAIVASDLTERRFVEASLRASASEAERRMLEQSTELETSQRELILARERTQVLLDAVTEQLPVGIVVADPEGRVVFRNEQSIRFWNVGQRNDGRTRRRGGAQGWQRIAPHQAAIARALTGEHVEDTEVEIGDGEHDYATVLVRADPIYDRAGGVIGAVCAIVDITARRHSEAIRDAFIDVTAHELKTPLTTVYGAAQTLVARDHALDPETRHGLLVDVAGEAERLVHLVDDMLVLSRVERGLDFVAHEPLLLEHIAQEFVEARARRAGHQKETVRILDGYLPVVAGERLYIEQILDNFVRNAEKYGQPPVEIEVEAGDNGTIVRVLDRGPGFSSAPEALFDLYYREADAMRRASGGGIGLFVCRELARLMGGRVWAANRPDGGAEFGFFLPAYVEPGL